MLSQIIYITRDIERALGCLTTPSVSIISNDSDFAKSIKERYPKQIFLIEDNKTLDTYELLEHPKTTEVLSHLTNPQILVFKNTSRIEKWCATNNYPLLNPPAKLAASLEEKLTQLETLDDLIELMPRYKKKTIEDLHWFREPYIIQFNHSHTGSGTVLIDSEEKLDELKKVFAKRECRIAPFISGPIFTSNIVVGIDAILTGNMSYQITGLQPFTDETFATIGNDWGAPYSILNDSERAEYELISREIAKKLQSLRWKGLFGIDAIWSTQEKRWYVIEINARQPASASYESMLQKNTNSQPSNLTILEAHLKALQGESLKEYSLTKITDGAQIIHRVTKKITSPEQAAHMLQKLDELRFETWNTKKLTIIPYENTSHNSDLLRIQSEKSIIHGDEFTEVGEKILKIIQ